MAANGTWEFVVADPKGNALCDLGEATNRSVTFTRNGVPVVAASVSHEDPAAAIILGALGSGIPLLKGYRNGVLRSYGYLAPFQETLEESTSLELLFRGPFGRMLGDGESRGFFYEAAAFTQTSLDAAVIASLLIGVAINKGFDAIQIGTVESTVLQSVDYSFPNAGEGIVDLSALDGGFDFEVAPVDSAPLIGTINFYASQGTTKPDAIFEYGPDTLANVRSVSRQTAPPINRVFCIGGQSFGNQLTSLQQDLGSQAAYGVWPIQPSAPDCQTQTHLDAYAKSLLRPTPVRSVSFTPDLGVVNCPRPWDDFWIGDTVPFHGRRGAFSESVPIRVDEIKLLIDDDGNETFDLTPSSGAASAPVTYAGDSYGAPHENRLHSPHSQRVQPPGGRLHHGTGAVAGRPAQHGHIRGEAVGQ